MRNCWKIIFLLFTSTFLISAGADRPVKNYPAVKIYTDTTTPITATDVEETIDLTEEKECPKNKFWHIQGQKCVPNRCPHTRPIRDPESGGCKRMRTNEDDIRRTRAGWPVRIMGFHQPRGLALDPMFKIDRNGKRVSGNIRNSYQRKPRIRSRYSLRNTKNDIY